MEGGSRSGKTWSAIDFIIMLCAENQGKSLVFFLLKETYASFKTTLFEDFNTRLPQHGIVSPLAHVKDAASMTLFGNKLHFIGADKPSKLHSAGCDYFYINEALDISQAIFEQLEMRCRRFWFMDFNPKTNDHWIFDRLERRPDINFFKSTMLDNPFIGKWEKRKILSYEPNPENIRQGTADEFMWNVYGLGIRSAQSGLVFPKINIIDDSYFPADQDYVYGMDFGFTNDPTTLVKVAKMNGELFIKELFYLQGLTTADIDQSLSKAGVKRAADRIWGDRSEPRLMKELRDKGWLIHGCDMIGINFSIDIMKQYRINVTRSSVNLSKELSNYVWDKDKKTSKPMNEPVGGYDHAIDAARYAIYMKYGRKQRLMQQTN